MGFDSFGDFTLESFAVLSAGLERISTGTPWCFRRTESK
jgi:hypothetical protein